jgi:hypothetical protein
MSESMIVDELLPVYDVSDGVAVVVEADTDTTWDALMAADMIALGKRRPLVAIFSGLRLLPELVVRVLHGEGVPKSPKHLTLRGTAEVESGKGGWTLLAERPGKEIALGLVGKFWRPVIPYANVTADEFQRFDEPGYAKTVYALSVRPLAPGRTLLTGVMRTATTDDHARRWFRRYWTLGVGSGAHVLVNALLEVVREDATGRAELKEDVA